MEYCEGSNKYQDETLDDLILGNYKIFQARAGYRFSLDAVMLAHFAVLENVDSIVDLGTGSGVIPHLLAARSSGVKITGIELQKALAERAARSVEINRLSPRISIIQGDIRQISSLMAPGSAKLVVSNPPFRRLGTGKQSTNREQAIARHEIEGRLIDFVKAAAYLLKPGGSFCMIHKTERLLEVLQLFKDNLLQSHHLRTIHSFPEKEAGSFLLEGIRGGVSNFIILPPLIVYKEPGIYSEEVQSWYGK